MQASKLEARWRKTIKVHHVNNVELQNVPLHVGFVNAPQYLFCILTVETVSLYLWTLFYHLIAFHIYNKHLLFDFFFFF